MSIGRGWLTRRYQFIVLDDASGGPARRFRISPRALLLFMLALIAAGATAGWLAAGQRARPPMAPAHPEWKQQLQQAHNRLAEADAELRIRNARIAALNQELQQSKRQIDTLSHRIRIYESILEARKTAGVRILRAHARWAASDAIAYDIVLVKGGNYPRRVSGRLRLVALAGDGRKKVVPLSDGEPELPYRLETHTFLHGRIPWTETWRPARLRVIRLNRKGEPRDQVDIRIEEEPDA